LKIDGPVLRAKRQKRALKGKRVSLKLFKKKNLNNEAILLDINGSLASLKNRFSKSELYFIGLVSYLLLPSAIEVTVLWHLIVLFRGPHVGKKKILLKMI
jgi:hypothetical protein